MTKSNAVILVDGNNIGMSSQGAVMPVKGQHRRLFAGDVETTAIFGTLRTLRTIRQDFAGRLIVLWDGRSWRYDAYPQYKATRTTSSEHMGAIRDAWKSQKPLLAKFLRSIGVEQVAASNMEADDLAARMRRLYNQAGREVVLVSGDSDWLQLVNERTSIYNPTEKKRVTLHNFAEQTKYPAPKIVVDVKALKGDTGDNISGVGGVGEKTVANIIAQFGSVNGLLNGTLGDPALCATLDKRILAFLEDTEKQARYRANLKIIDLDHPEAPKIERHHHVKAKLDEEAFQALCDECAFTTMTRDPTWLATFRE
jgi:DNA polymerase-1